MDTKDHPVISVLGDPKRFMVPIYQRDYRWRDDKLQPFWEDVVAKAEETLEGPPKFKHYMGALIIAPGSDGYVVGATPKVQVVDGQQRLTTFQIFLATLREVADKLELTEIGGKVDEYLFNPLKFGDKDPSAKFKLVPTSEDRAIFNDIVEGGWKRVRTTHSHCFYKNGNLIGGAAPNALRAFAFFTWKIEDYVLYGDYDPEEGRPSAPEVSEQQRERLSALLEALLNHLKLVVITLDETDDAQVIFETLNSRGEPLLAMDLVRNNIFHRAEAQGENAKQLFETKWRPLDSPFWKADSPRAKPKRPRIDHFLSHALTAQTGEEASLRELYAEYRSFARPRGKPRFATVEEELDALLAFAPIYQALERPDGDGSLAYLGRKLAVWEVATAYPLIFRVAISSADEATKDQIYRLVYSYIVRRALCDLPSKNLNKNFQRMVAHLLRNGVSVESFSATFAGQSGPNVVFPNDEQLRAALRTVPVYQRIRRSERLQDVLWEIERCGRTKYNVSAARPAAMSIEHVMPFSWEKHWPLPDGRMAPLGGILGADDAMVNAMITRANALQTLGNLTLMTGPANTVASNGPFESKREWLKQSLLALNLDIADRPEWNELEIAARAQRLADLAIQIWPALPVSS